MLGKILPLYVKSKLNMKKDCFPFNFARLLSQYDHLNLLCLFIIWYVCGDECTHNLNSVVWWIKSILTIHHFLEQLFNNNSFISINYRPRHCVKGRLFFLVNFHKTRLFLDELQYPDRKYLDKNQNFWPPTPDAFIPNPCGVCTWGVLKLRC